MNERTFKNIGYVAGRWPLDPDMPTLVFIHGSGGSSVLWEKQVDELKAYVNTIALDLPGHGRSSGPGMDSVAEYCVVVADFIETVEVPEPVPCGLSIGGAIVLQLILEHKTRYKSAILVNTGARLRVKPVIFESIKKNYERFLRTIPAFAASEKTDPRKLDSLMADMAKCDPETAFGDFKACDRFDVTDKLPAIITPVLILTAEDDKLTPPKFGVYLKEHIRNASMANIKDAGHLSPLEQPEAFNKVVTDFLKQENLII